MAIPPARATLPAMSRRLALTALPLLAAVAPAAPAHAATAPPTVGGPFGVKIVRPAATAACDQELRLGVRFTKASARAGVRDVQVRLRGTKTSFTVPDGGRRGFTTVRLSPACGTTVTVEYRVRRRAKRSRGTQTRTKRYRVAVAARTQAPVGPGGIPQEPGGPAPLPAATAADPDGARTWLALADLRSSGARKGQTCVQTIVDGPAGRTAAGSTFCGLPEQDAVVAAARTHDGRTVVTGVAGPQVAALAITGPFGAQALTPASKAEASDEGGEFVAVYDGAAVAPAQLGLQVTLVGGQVVAFPDIRALHWRTAAGAPA